MRVLGSVLAGLALAVLVIGLALIPLLHPTFTKLLAQRYSLTAQAGLTEAEMLHYAEQVREFVADGDVDWLPAKVDGRAGFDDAAVSHLRDVRGVLANARTITGVLAALVVLWLGLEITRGRLAAISSALLFGAVFCLAFVVLGALAGLVNFDALFTWFHGLFFSAGTWEFPADSLLIELFPEAFWIAAGTTWAVLVGIGGAVLGGAGWFIRVSEARAKAGRAAVPNGNSA